MAKDKAEKNRIFGRRRVLFAAVAVLLGLSPLFALELCLRAFEIGKPSGYADPFVGFSDVYPLFELDADGSQYQTSSAHLYFFGRQTFAVRKPPNGFRAFCLGGSTVLGHPFQPDTAFPKWLEVELSGRDPGRDFEMVNCGGMSYASYRLVPILEEVLGYDPDLIVVMTGHNEFLEDRTYREIKERSAVQTWLEDRAYSLHTVTLARRLVGALGGTKKASKSDVDQRTVLKPVVDARLDHGTGYASYQRDPAWSDAVLKHYRHNLSRMVDLCRASDVPLVFVNPGTNLRDCPPFKSEHGAGVDDEAKARWSAALDAASAADVVDPQKALLSYERAVVIDGDHAELVYRMARCLDRLGRIEAARPLFLRAKDLDVCPLRILEPMNEILLDVIRTSETPSVDARALLERISPDGIPGSNCYVDHVHPGVRGHQIIAEALAERLTGLGLVDSVSAWDARQRRRAYRRHIDSLGRLYFVQGRARVESLDRWARRDRLRLGTSPRNTRDHLDLARAQIEFGEDDEAHKHIEHAARLELSSLSRVLDDAFELFEEGRDASARGLVELVRRLAMDAQVIVEADLAIAMLALEEGDKARGQALYDSVKPRLSPGLEAGRRWLRVIEE